MESVAWASVFAILIVAVAGHYAFQRYLEHVELMAGKEHPSFRCNCATDTDSDPEDGEVL